MGSLFLFFLFCDTVAIFLSRGHKKSDWLCLTCISSLFCAIVQSCNVRCMNGGSCSEDSCSCPKGYTGNHCGQRESDYLGLNVFVGEGCLLQSLIVILQKLSDLFYFRLVCCCWSSFTFKAWPMGCRLYFIVRIKLLSNMWSNKTSNIFLSSLS